MHRLTPILFLAALGCDPSKDSPGEETAPPGDSVNNADSAADPDADGDGFTTVDDCDDGDAAINPAAEEVCDGQDNNCDGAADEGVLSTWYPDGDADGYGVLEGAVEDCEAPEGYSALGEDCDDADERFHPGADESDCADPNDYNCDGSVGYDDNDGDGFAACQECDDGDAAVSPGATETCDAIDNDCDGSIDDADDSLDTSTATTYYRDGDADGYGDVDFPTLACALPAGYAADATDCDDGASGVNPGATEVCSGVDEDCDTLIDDADPSLDTTSGSVFYADADSDGYGDPDADTRACEAPAGT
ncbi:putative metal-binding motif-containing protein, partial [Myxococcota bacterium]|nr:putative metal-binding motif-containing protein [Myxococcota bacterium]